MHKFLDSIYIYIYIYYINHKPSKTNSQTPLKHGKVGWKTSFPVSFWGPRAFQHCDWSKVPVSMTQVDEQPSPLWVFPHVNPTYPESHFLGMVFVGFVDFLGMFFFGCVPCFWLGVNNGIIQVGGGTCFEILLDIFLWDFPKKHTGCICMRS